MSSATFAIAGLGNPGEKYRETRHNAGFWVLDLLAEKAGAKWESGFGSHFAKVRLADSNVLLVKPQRYMNRSGEQIQEILAYYKIAAESLIVVHDEVDILPGALKIKRGGSSGGHNGVESVSQNLGTPEFIRVRFGVGRPTDSRDAADWVLSKPSKDEREALVQTTKYAADAVISILENGMEEAVRRYNRKEFRQ